MIHGCTEPSSTLHPYAFAIAAHNITDAIGANANAAMKKSANAYQSHGNFLCGLSIGLRSFLDDLVLLGPFPKRGELGR